MSGDDLKSAEKRAADAAIEKENMRVAMTATEQKAISTTYVSEADPLHDGKNCCIAEKRPHIPPLTQSEWVGYGVFLAFNKFSICAPSLTDLLTTFPECNAANARSSRSPTHKPRPALPTNR